MATRKPHKNNYPSVISTESVLVRSENHAIPSTNVS